MQLSLSDAELSGSHLRFSTYSFIFKGGGEIPLYDTVHNFTFLPLLYFLIVWALLCGRWALYFSECSRRNFYSSVEGPDPCNNHFYHGLAHHFDDLYIFLALAAAAHLRVGCRDIFSCLKFPGVTNTVDICLDGCFRRCSLFVNLFSDIHVLKYLIGLPVGLDLEIPTLYICLLGTF